MEIKSSLLILHLEDEQNDAELVKRTLAAGDIKCTILRAQSREEFLAALENGGIDLVLSDFSLPSYDGFRASQLVKKRWPDIPFIFVSGTIAEDQAIELLNSGAVDYVLKHRMSRLVPAVLRALREARLKVERKRMEAQLVESQKMELIGHLAGGVAHDFGNILAIIMGYNDLLMRELPQASPLIRYTESIRFATERAAGLSKQLLLFSRKESAKPIPLNLNQTLIAMEKMLRHIIPRQVQLSLDLSEQPISIIADPGYIGQVIMNLVINACDAMPEGGTLTIKTEQSSLEAGEPSDDQAQVEMAVLCVSDTGTGMTEEVKKKIFQAFFTTKPEGKGTGLGLAICHTIIQQTGGFIDLTTAPGEGTTFKIYFPKGNLNT